MLNFCLNFTCVNNVYIFVRKRPISLLEETFAESQCYFGWRWSVAVNGPCRDVSGGKVFPCKINLCCFPLYRRSTCLTVDKTFHQEGAFQVRLFLRVVVERLCTPGDTLHAFCYFLPASANFRHEFRVHVSFTENGVSWSLLAAVWSRLPCNNEARDHDTLAWNSKVITHVWLFWSIHIL